MLDALRERLTKADCSVEFHVNPACFSAKPVRALEKLAHDHPATAWLLFTSREPMQRWLIRRQLPCLVVGSCAPDIALPSIDADHRAACRHAGGVLLRKGHRRIALVLPQDAHGGDADSEQGMRESLKGTPEVHLRVLSHDGTTAHLCSLAGRRHALTQSADRLCSWPRVCMSLTVMIHLMRRGKRIPQDRGRHLPRRRSLSAIHQSGRHALHHQPGPVRTPCLHGGAPTGRNRHARPQTPSA